MSYFKRLSVLLLCLQCCSLWAAQVKVGNVEVKAVDSFDTDPTDAVLSMCAVQAGYTGEQTDVQQAISADVQGLLSTPYYSNVTSSIGVAEDGSWTIIYTVSRRAQLAAEPAIMGLDGTIRMTKAQDALKLAVNERIDDALAMTAGERLKAVLAKNDFVNAHVSYKITETAAPGYVTITYTVVPGMERTIRDYIFTGNASYDHDVLAEKFGWVPFYNPLGWFRDLPVTDQKLDDARAVVEGFYIEEGFLDAEVEGPIFEQVSRSDKVDARFDITEGERYTIGKITINGATAYPQENLERVAYDVLKAEGNVATQTILSHIQSAIQDFYGSRGYVDTFAQLQKRGSDQESVVDLEFTLTEGERARIRAISIQGNTVTQDKVIRREIVIQPGEEYDERLIKRSKARLQNLNYFLPEAESGVTSYTVKTGEPGVRDLVFNVREERTGDYGIGVGVSTIDSVFVFAKATQNNFDLFNPGNGFRGGGQRASAGIEIGGRRQTAEVSWTQPWLYDMPLSLTIDAYRKLRWYDHYDQINTGAAFTLSWKPMSIPLPWGKEFQMDRIGIKYTLENVTYDDPDSGTWYKGSNDQPFAFTNQKDGINSKIRLFWQENHRNKPFVPTSGWESLAYIDIGALGDAKDYGFGFNFSKWWNPWLDHVLMTRFRFDTVEAYNGDVPMFDRYFIGGGRTIRGFDYRDGGPKAYQQKGKRGDHVAIGGQTLWCTTFEYSIPLVSVLRFAVFTDIGAVGEDFCDLGSDLLWSAGVGFRLDIPKFPIRIDFAKPITNDDDTDEQVFTFWIGID